MSFINNFIKSKILIYCFSVLTNLETQFLKLGVDFTHLRIWSNKIFDNNTQKKNVIIKF